jgi:hypothetical protein
MSLCEGCGYFRGGVCRNSLARGRCQSDDLLPAAITRDQKVVGNYVLALRDDDASAMNQLDQMAPGLSPARAFGLLKQASQELGS